MIKIEYMPPTPKVPEYRANCKCGCVFTFSETDKYKKCFGHGDFEMVVRCPHCGNYIGRTFDESVVVTI